jgi:hypothetical protein
VRIGLQPILPFPNVKSSNTRNGSSISKVADPGLGMISSTAASIPPAPANRGDKSIFLSFFAGMLKSSNVPTHRDNCIERKSKYTCERKVVAV